MSRRKGVMQGLREEVEPPNERQQVAQVVNARGGNIVEVTLPDGRSTLCLLPNKFNKKLWLKRGGYAIIEEVQEAQAQQADQGPQDGGEADTPPPPQAPQAASGQQQQQQQGKITGTIVAVLYDEHIRQLKKVPGAWPVEFTAEGRLAASQSGQLAQEDSQQEEPQEQQQREDGDEDEDSDSGLPALQANTNRKVIVHYVSDSEGDEDDH